MKPQQETGITFRFFKSELKDGRFVSNYSEGNKNSPNGFYKNGEIYIDINAGANGEGLILFTASHELVHFMRDFAPEQFDGFAKFLFDNYAKKGLSVRQAVHREMMMHQKLKYDEAYEEVVARLSESFLRDAHLSEKSAELYNTDKNIWEKVRDGLKSIVDRIEKHFAGVSPDSDLGKIGEKMARENKDILDRFVAGIREAADNAAYTKNTTDEGGVRMMAREIETITDERAKELLEWAEYGEYNDNTYIPMRKDTPPVLIASTKGRDTGEILDRPMLIPVGKARQSLTPEGEYYKGDGKGHGLERYQIVSAIRNLDKPKRLFFEKERNRYAALVSYEDSKGNLALIPIDFEQNINPVYLNGYEGGIYNVSVSVFNQEDIDSYANNSDHIEIDIKREDDPQRGSSGSALSHLNESSSTDIIISDSSEKGNTSDKKRLEQSRDDDYLSAVNRGDMETAQRMVDEAAERAFANSKVRGKGRKLLKMYHGTDADFTVFDIVKYGGKTGTAEGLGINLIDRKDGASKYGGRVIESYVDIKKPAKTWEKTITKGDLVKLIRKSAEVDAQKMVENDEYDSIDDALKDTWISNYVNTYEYYSIEDAYKAVADAVLEYNTNDRDIVWEIVNGSGANYSNQTWSDFYSDILKPTIGIDGFWTIWEAKDGKKANVVIAFDSSQVKSADPVTYDDNGDVIPLSERFNTEEQDIRFDERDELTGEDDMWTLSEYDDITDAVVRHYTTRSEAIGEVLKNTADIDVAAGKVKNIVSRLMNSRFVGVDSDTKKKLATALHLELENVKNVEPEQVTDRMIDAVRNVIKGAKVEDPTYSALYDDFKTAFSGKYYLTDEQLADLNENGYTLNDFKKAMSGIGTIVDKAKADKSITGGIKGASQLSFEGFNDYSESSIQQLFGINPEQWDEFDYHAPVMMMDAISELKEKREVPLSKMASADDIDYIATQIAAQFTGAVIQEKYNSRRNPYVRDLVDKFEQRKKDAVKKRNEYYKGKMKELREQRDRKIAEQQKKYQTAREEASGEMLKFFLVL